MWSDGSSAGMTSQRDATVNPTSVSSLQKIAGAEADYCHSAMNGKDVCDAEILDVIRDAPGTSFKNGEESMSNHAFQEVLGRHLARAQQVLAEDLHKTLQMVTAHLTKAARQQVHMDGVRTENKRLSALLADHGFEPAAAVPSRSQSLQITPHSAERHRCQDPIPGMANIDESMSTVRQELTLANVRSNSLITNGNWRRPSDGQSGGRGSSLSVAKGALKSSARESKRTSISCMSNVTFCSEEPSQPEIEKPEKIDELYGSQGSDDLGSISSGSDSAMPKPPPSLKRKDSTVSRISQKSPDLRFEVLPVWEKDNISVAQQVHESKYRGRKSLRRVSTNLFEGTESEVLRLRELRGDSRISPMVVHPNSITRGFWDTASFCLIVYDVVMIPFQLFDPGDHLVLDAMAWFTRFFWTIDMIMSVNTGYATKDGNFDMRHSTILRRYVRTWFGLDLMLVSLDWLELLWSGSSSLGVARVGKAARVFRILRMLRVLRMRQAIKLITERIRSERLFILTDITKIVLVIIGFAHISACFWYGIGVQGDAGRRTWVSEGLLADESLAYRYMTSLHWSLSQFSGGMDEVRPYNTEERSYCLVVFIVSFMIAAVLTSSLTSAMTRLHMLATRQSQQLSKLRRFLADNGVSRVLAMRVQRNANHAMMEQERYQQEINVELLSVISAPIKMELHFEMYSPILSRHPFFNKYAEECPHVMRKVCHRSTAMSLVSFNDIIFNAGELPLHPKMFWVCNGNLSYFSMHEQAWDVNEGDWISEGVLWTAWMHRGSLRANGDCRLCELDARSFQDIVGQFDHAFFDPKDYAAKFVRGLNLHQGEVTDLHLELHDDGEGEASRENSYSPRRTSFTKVAEEVAETVKNMGDTIHEVSSTLVRRVSNSGEQRRWSWSTPLSKPTSMSEPNSPKANHSPVLPQADNTIEVPQGEA